MKQIGVKNVKLSEYEMSIAAHLVDPLNMHVRIFNLISDFFGLDFCVRGPGNDQVWWLFRRNHRSPHSFVLLGTISYSKWIQDKISKKRGAWDEIWRKLGTGFQESSTVNEVTLLQQHVVRTHVKCHPPGRLPRYLLAPTVLTGTSHVDYTS